MYCVLVPVDENEAAAERTVETVLSLPGEPDDLVATVLYVS